MKYARYVLLGLLLAVAACSTATTDTTSAPGSTSTTTVAPPTSVASTSTTTLTTTTLVTTTVAPPTSTSTTQPPGEAPATFDTETLGIFPEPLPGSEGAAGSGCAPGTDSLPDGAWFGFVTDRTADGIVFDLACFWSGERANEVALAHGETDVPVPNDYYISNDSDRVRSLDIFPDTPVLSLDYTGNNSSEDPYVLGTFEGWGTSRTYLNCDFDSPDEPFCLVWLFINDGAVTEMVEQYVP